MRNARLKRSPATAIGLVLALTAQADIVNSQENQCERVISVTGDGEVEVVPDEVSVSLGIETFDLHLSSARAENDRQMERVVGAIERLGVERRLVRTDYLRVEPRYGQRRDPRQFIGYYVDKRVVITLSDIDILDGLLTEVLEAGATSIHYVRFQITDDETPGEQARAMALQAAQEKADRMASELGEKIGRPCSISEDQFRSTSRLPADGFRVSAAMVKDAGAITPPGQIAVTARVHVTFELE